MSKWSNKIELREENGIMRAFRTRDGREVPIPKFPKPDVDMVEWLVHLSLDDLEAARQYYIDRWTWDSNEPRYLDLVALIVSEIAERHPLPDKLAGVTNTLQQQLDDWGRTTLDLTR